MAHQTVVDIRRSVVLPEDGDPVAVAAGMNPGMSAWVGLRRRISFQPGRRVLVLGATGNAGQLAIQVAGTWARPRSSPPAARRAVAALPALGATATVLLGAADLADRLAKTPPTSTSSSTTCGANPPPTP